MSSSASKERKLQQLQDIIEDCPVSVIISLHIRLLVSYTLIIDVLMLPIQIHEYVNNVLCTKILHTHNFINKNHTNSLLHTHTNIFSQILTESNRYFIKQSNMAEMAPTTMVSMETIKQHHRS